MGTQRAEPGKGSKQEVPGEGKGSLKTQTLSHTHKDTEQSKAWAMGWRQEKVKFLHPTPALTAFASGKLPTLWHWGLARAILQLVLSVPRGPIYPLHPPPLPSSSPARKRPTACCHCCPGSSGPRPAAAGTAWPPGEPAGEGTVGYQGRAYLLQQRPEGPEGGGI